MRKSAAPSMRKRHHCQKQENTISSTTNNEDDEEQYAWGTSGNASSCWQDKKLDIYENILANKRIFKVVWREFTLKKNKIWKGDGVLEINMASGKAVLKDDTGKYLGSCDKVNLSTIKEDYEMNVGSKEIQILEPIQTIEQLEVLKKEQFENRSWGDDECLTIEQCKKPKGAFVFNCPINVSRPQLQDRKYKHGKSEEIIENQIELKECICLLNPSELQHILLERLKDHYNENTSTEKIEDVLLIANKIYNHPSLLNSDTFSGSIVESIKPLLPEWCDMGPYDSTKLEFLMDFIKLSSKVSFEKSIIWCDDIKSLEMLQNFFDFLKIKIFVLKKLHDVTNQQRIINDFNRPSDEGSILLIEETDVLFDLNNVSNVIFFNFTPEFEKKTERIKTSVSSINVYQLLVVDCFQQMLCNSVMMGKSFKRNEERIEKVAMKTFIENLLDLVNDGGNYENWQDFVPPFSTMIKKDTKLEGTNENLAGILFRNVK